jgi:hypothetical protein
VSTFLGKKAENFPKCEVTRLHYYINLWVNLFRSPKMHSKILSQKWAIFGGLWGWYNYIHSIYYIF